MFPAAAAAEEKSSKRKRWGCLYHFSNSISLIGILFGQDITCQGAQESPGLLPVRE